MLTICNDILPHGETVYAAFRLAACETLERMVLDDQIGGQEQAAYGYLTEVPFLKHVPPQVQIDQLADTWCRHVRPELQRATLVDESVIYAVCETAARLVAADPAACVRFLGGGPRPFDLPVDRELARRIEALHLGLANEGDFLLISQFQDIPPDEALPLKRKFRLDIDACEAMFELVGRWYVSPLFDERAAGLLTDVEIARAIDLFRFRRSAALQRSS